jgi:hypothetical protein
VDSALWIGAMTGLAGAVIGGAITYLVSVQQAKDARVQRQEAEQAEAARRSVDRRLAAYADFLTPARQFRDVIRPPHHCGAGLRVPLQEIDVLARSANSAGSLVFLLAEASRAGSACGTVMRTIGEVVGALHDGEKAPDHVRWEDLNERMSRVLREFQEAVRTELQVPSDQPAAQPVP